MLIYHCFKFHPDLTRIVGFSDDELPDYVMVMVANKRTRAQMEDDLQLFLGDNTELFVSWLHQVLKKLQEVTVAAPSKLEMLVLDNRSCQPASWACLFSSLGNPRQY